MVFPAIVTAPFLDNALPLSLAPVLNEMDSFTMMVPLKTEVVPKVAELPTCQKILEAFAPPARITFRPEVTVSDEATWITKTAFGLFFASKVTSPDDKAREEVDL